jgi:signal transduction histidine kinase
LVRRSLDLGALLAQVIEALRPAAREKGIALTDDLTAVPRIEADHDRLVQVFTNLIGNALKYTPQGGRVQVNVQRVIGEHSSGRHSRSTPQRGTSDKVARVGSNPEWVVVSVTDSGCGIPAEDLPRIFERFYQVDKARTARQGYGLGLAITREIVEAHGGHIGVESVQGLGSRFTVELPVSKVPALSDC